jgi:hypothetical protein
MNSREASGKRIWLAAAPSPAMPGGVDPAPLKTTVLPPKARVTEGVDPISPMKKLGAT